MDFVIALLYSAIPLLLIVGMLLMWNKENK
jgi:hypothetical protein